MDQISGMQENLRNDKSKFSLKHAVHKMELYRTAFLVNDYVRERLKKVTFLSSVWYKRACVIEQGLVHNFRLKAIREGGSLKTS